MARKVKCAITGEFGTSDTFIKVNNKYYKSQELYDSDKKNKDVWNEIIRFICEDLLGYQEGQLFPALIARKLSEYKFYDREVILRTFQKCSKDISYQINIDGKFSDDNGKIFYMFAIVKNNINNVYAVWKREQSQVVNVERNIIDNNIDLENINKTQSTKNLSAWVDEEDLL